MKLFEKIIALIYALICKSSKRGKDCWQSARGESSSARRMFPKKTNDDFVWHSTPSLPLFIFIRLKRLTSHDLVRQRVVKKEKQNSEEKNVHENDDVMTVNSQKITSAETLKMCTIYTHK